MSDRILFQSVTEFSDSKADKLQLIKGLLGAPIGGERVEVPNRPGYVYVRLRDNQNEFISAYNSEVALVYDLPVLVARDEINPNVYRVVGRDLAQYKDWGDSAYVPRHGNAHSFNLAGGGGGDIVWVYSEQIVPIEAIPSGSSGGPNVIIAEGVYWWNNEPIYAGNTGTLDILTPGNRPTGANGVRVVLVYLDGDTGLPGFISGEEEFDYTITGTMDLIPFLPDLPYGTVPITAVRIPTGTSSIVWENLYDLRNMYGNHFVDGEIVGGFTPGSVIFAGISGTLTEDNDDFYWDDANKNLLIGNNVSPFADDTTKIQILGNTGRNANFYMWGFSGTGTSVVPAFAGINFRGTQSNPTATLAGDILLRAFGAGHSGAALTASRVRMTFLADGDWDGSYQGAYINFQVTPTGSSTRRNIFDIHGNEVVFNPDQLNDLNFRIAGNVSPYLVFVDTGLGQVGIGGVPDDSKLQITNITNETSFEGDRHSVLRLRGGDNRNNNQYAILGFTSTDAELNFGAIALQMTPSGSIMLFGTSNNYATGVTNTSLKIFYDGSIVINDDGDDQDLRIEGDTDPNLLFIDAGNDIVAFGTNAPFSLTKVHIQQNADDYNTLFQNNTTRTNTSSVVTLYRHHSSGTVAAGFGIFEFFQLEDDAGVLRSAGYQQIYWADPSTGSYDTTMDFGIAVNSVLRVGLRFHTTLAAINPAQVDMDFRASSTGNANMIFMDAGNDRVAIGSAIPSDTFEVNGYALFDQAHGELYTYEAGLTVDCVLADTYYEVSGTTAGLSSGGNYVTLAAAGGDITIGSMGAGIYRVNFSISLEANKVCTLHGDVYINGVEQQNIAWEREIANPNDVGAAAAIGLLNLSANDVLDVRIKSSMANTTVMFSHMNLSINRFAR